MPVKKRNTEVDLRAWAQSPSNDILLDEEHYTPQIRSMAELVQMYERLWRMAVNDLRELKIEERVRLIREGTNPYKALPLTDEGFRPDEWEEGPRILHAPMHPEARSVSHDARPAPRQPVRRVGRASDGTRS